MTAELKIHYMPPDVTDRDTDREPPTSQPADLVALWRLVKAGDQRAFESVYRVCSGAVFGLCLRMCSNRAAAEDALQATFISAWEKRASFRGDARLNTWLHRIAVNAVLGEGRAEGRLRQVMESYAQTLTGDVPFADRPHAAQGIPGADRELEQAIADLPERSRQVFVLHAIHGYKHEEVAQMMGIAAGTSKAHFHRSRELLRAALSGTNDGSPR